MSVARTTRVMLVFLLTSASVGAVAGSASAQTRPATSAGRVASPQAAARVPLAQASLDLVTADLIDACAESTRRGYQWLLSQNSAAYVLSPRTGNPAEDTSRLVYFYATDTATMGREDAATFAAYLTQSVALMPTSRDGVEMSVCFAQRRIEQWDRGSVSPRSTSGAGEAIARMAPVSVGARPVDGNWNVRLDCRAGPRLDVTGPFIDGAMWQSPSAGSALDVSLRLRFSPAGDVFLTGLAGETVLEYVQAHADSDAGNVGTGRWGGADGCTFTATRLGN